jgi:hypothetical protein
MKVAILASVVAAVNANYYGNSGYQPNPCLANPYAPGCVKPQPPCTGYGCVCLHHI